MVKATVIKKKLECSSIGDTRFSALYAHVTLLGVTKTIEEWWQFSKIWECSGRRVIPKNWREAKSWKYKFNYKVIGFHFLGKEIPCCLGNKLYSFLWVVYFQQNPNLLKVIDEYDEFHDTFKSKNSYVCQADVISDIKSIGLDAYIDSLVDLIELLQT